MAAAAAAIDPVLAKDTGGPTRPASVALTVLLLATVAAPGFAGCVARVGSVAELTAPGLAVGSAGAGVEVTRPSG